MTLKEKFRKYFRGERSTKLGGYYGYYRYIPEVGMVLYFPFTLKDEPKMVEDLKRGYKVNI